MRKKVCMVVPSFTAKGGITSVVNGYRNSQLTEDYDVRFIETYCDGSAIQKTSKALSAYLKFIYTVFFGNQILFMFILLLEEVFIERL